MNQERGGNNKEGMEGRGELLARLVFCRLSTCRILVALLGWLASEWWRVQLYSGRDGGVEREFGLAPQAVLLVSSSSLRFSPPPELLFGGPEERR